MTDTSQHAIPLNLSNRTARFTRLLAGPPQTHSLKSGLVVLQPGENVGEHCTDGKEELVVVLEGVGEFRAEDQEALQLSAGRAVYCAPGTQHDVYNTGSTRLCYVYVTAAIPSMK